MFSVRIINQGTIQRGLQSFQDRLDGRKGTLYPDLGKMVRLSILSNFKAGGRDPKWPARKQAYPWPILEKTGTMRTIATHTALQKWIFNGPIRILRVYGPEYGVYQQYGVKKNNLPARKFVKLTPTRRAVMIDRIRREWRSAWREQ